MKTKSKLFFTLLLILCFLHSIFAC